MKNLKLMLVLLAAFCGSLCSFHAEASKTIYAIYKAPWTRIYAHCWNGNGDTTGTWGNDGEQMKATSEQHEGYTVYTCTVDDSFTTMKLHQNYTGAANETTDINDIEHNALYIVNNDSGNNSNRSWSKVSNFKTKVDAPDADLYLRGFDGWDKNDKYKLTKSGNVFSGMFTSLTGNTEFKIGSGESTNWAYSYSTGLNDMVAGTTYECNSGNNMKLKETLNNVTVTLDFSGTTPKLTFTTETVVDPDSYTVYVAKRVTDWNDLCVYVYNNDGTNAGAWGSLHVTDKTNLKYQDMEVYSYTFDNEFEYIIFSNGSSNGYAQTGSKPFKKDALYVIDTDIESGNRKLEVVEDPVYNHYVPESERTLYIHFGQNFHDHGDLTKAPRVIFYKSQQTAGNMSTDGYKEMTKVTGYGLTENDHLYKFTLSEADAKEYTDAVIFFLHKDNNNDKDFYCCGKLNNGDSFAWDSENWLKYIYYADADQKAAQSYITIDEYLALRQNTPDRIYMTGSGFKEFDDARPDAGATSGCWSITAPNMLSADATMNVFYPQFTWSSTSQLTKTFESGSKTGAAFKMSWLQPYDWYEKHGNGSDIHNQRCWATFNLGLIGYNLEKVEGNQQLKDALKPEVMDEAPTKNVLIRISSTMPHNNYNQFNWFIENQTAEDLTLVVDLDDDCQSVTLLPYEPNPTIKADDKISVKPALYKYENSFDLRGSNKFKAEATNGMIAFKYVNIASADATIYGPTATQLGTNHHVDFEVYSNGQRAGSYVAHQGFDSQVKVHLSAIAFGSDATLGVRGKYTDNRTGMTFHTKYSFSNVGGTAELKAPTITRVKEKSAVYTPGSQFIYEVDDDGKIQTGVYGEPILITDNSRNPRYTMGARGVLEVMAPDYADDDEMNDLIWYGDFHADIHESSTDRGHHKDHPWHANGGTINGLGHTRAVFPTIGHHTLYKDFHNWAQMLGKATSDFPMASEWDIELPEVVEIHRTFAEDGESWTEDIPETFTVKAQVGAVYPFLIDANAKIEIASASPVQAAPRKGAPRKVDTYTPAGDHEYSIVSIPVYSAYEPIVLTADKSLTGIFDVKGDDAAAGAFDENAPVEYYNLQGMRLSAAPESGFYIRRQGSKTEKIIIR